MKNDFYSTPKYVVTDIIVTITSSQEKTKVAIGRIEEANEVYPNVVSEASTWQIRNAGSDFEEFLLLFPSFESEFIKLSLKFS